MQPGGEDPRLRGDADDRVGYTAQPNIRSDDLWIFGEAVDPDRATQNDLIFTPLPLFIGSKQSPETRLHPKNLEEVRSDRGPAHDDRTTVIFERGRPIAK